MYIGGGHFSIRGVTFLYWKSDPGVNFLYGKVTHGSHFHMTPAVPTCHTAHVSKAVGAK